MSFESIANDNEMLLPFCPTRVPKNLQAARRSKSSFGLQTSNFEQAHAELGRFSGVVMWRGRAGNKIASHQGFAQWAGPTLERHGPQIVLQTLFLRTRSNRGYLCSAHVFQANAKLARMRPPLPTTSAPFLVVSSLVQSFRQWYAASKSQRSPPEQRAKKRFSGLTK